MRFISVLRANGVRISMDCKGRCLERKRLSALCGTGLAPCGTLEE
jgi:hypothetical protein